MRCKRKKYLQTLIDKHSMMRWDEMRWDEMRWDEMGWEIEWLNGWLTNQQTGKPTKSLLWRRAKARNVSYALFLTAFSIFTSTFSLYDPLFYSLRRHSGSTLVLTGTSISLSLVDRLSDWLTDSLLPVCLQWEPKDAAFLHAFRVMF